MRREICSIITPGVAGHGSIDKLYYQKEHRVLCCVVEQSLQDDVQVSDSEIGRKILGGAPVLREKPFEIRLDEGGQMRLVQGVIDLMVLEADGATLVDYKTDHTGLEPESVRQRHGAQVRLYREAAQRAGLVVKRSLVYLFSTGNAVEIE